jgi:hypothetical protein
MPEAVAPFDQVPGERFMDSTQSRCNVTKVLADVECKPKRLQTVPLPSTPTRNMA